MRARNVLIVAEKPSIAKQVAAVLSSNYQSASSKNKFCRIFSLELALGNQIWNVKITSVLGHISSMSFSDEYRNWDLVNPKLLIRAPISIITPEEMKDVANNLKSLARDCETLIIMTDCDREGEYIGYEVKELCLKGNPRLDVKRANFSSLTKRDLLNALSDLDCLNMNLVKSVGARMELDLRTGASLTRIQSVRLRDTTQTKEVISYGPCQFPTLGFIVEQFVKSNCFIPEKFQTLELKVYNSNTTFKWDRGNIFDEFFVSSVHQHLLQFSNANDIRNSVQVVLEFCFHTRKPLPLRTVEFQKAMSRIFKYSGHKCMQIAEKLYNGGYLSYPRTETDRYSSDFDFEHILKSLADDIFLGDFVKSLMSKEISAPRKGKNDDRAHPPIHPLKSGSELSGDERRVFDYVTRRFLASLCLDAEYSDTLLNCRVGDELFFCQGKMLLKKNYLDVFTYDTFQENTIPNFKEGDILEVYSLKVHSGSTTSPSLLNEADLINAMDKNGIGTDATIHEHIQKVLERGYAINDHGRFIPTPLGVGLVVGYDQIFSDLSLTKPYMRAQLEEDVQKISRGTLNPEYVIDKYLRSFEDVLDRIGNFFHILVGTIDYYKLNMKSFTPQESNGESLPNHSKETHNNGKRPRKKGLTRPRKREKPCSTEDLSGDVRCRCGLIAVERTSKTSSSHGKKFYSCSKKVYRCDFFEWKN